MRSDSVVTAELEAIERTRTRIVVTSVLALAVLVSAFVIAPPSAVVVVVIILAVALKKAAVRYAALGRMRSAMRDSDDSESVASGKP